MEKTTLATNNYNYYPRTMISLCNIAYDDIKAIPNAVKGLGLEVVWGPAELKGTFGIAYSLMYVVYNKATQEYTVVIRGTNADSLWSWLSEDFEVGSTKPFNLIAPHAPANALISKATYDGMTDLLKLRDHKTKQSISEFLKAADPRYLYVTGHSLGGTLTPTMFAYLNDVLYGGGYVHNMASWSFAGLTSGDKNFAAYLNSLSNPEFAWRIHNPLDIAPFFFDSLSNVQNIYDSYGLPWSSLDIILRGLIDGLFYDASGKNYTQPLGDQVLPVSFNHNENGWAEQAYYQHHSTTYITLVNQQYPL